MMKQVYFVLAICLFSVTAHSQDAIAVSKKGKGQPVIFLPGFACAGSVWDNTIQHLGDGYQSHSITYAGFAGVSPVSTPWYSKVRDGIIAYIQKEKLEQVILIGHSMGGNLATEIATTLPAICRKVIIVDALSCMREIMMPGVSADQVTYDNPYNQQLLAMTGKPFNDYVRNMATGMVKDSGEVKRLSDWMLEADRKTFVYGYTDLLKMDLRDQLSKITAPVLILGASYMDTSVAKKNFEQQYANLKQKAILIAPDSRHFIMLDQPEWFYQQVREFLKQ